MNTYHSKSIKNFSFLVTGGAGFIGSNLVAYLLHHGAKKVRVIDDLSNGYKKNIETFLSDERFEFVEGSITDFSLCNKVVEGIDYVSHQAALGSVPRSINDPITSNDVNISGFLNILNASKNAGVKRFIYAASSSTYGDSQSLPKVEDVIGKPLSPYAVTKYVNELYADVFSKIYGFHTIGMRYFNVFGPKQDPNGAYAAVIPLFIDAVMMNESPKINGDGGQTRDFTYIENVIQANIKALLIDELNQSEVINVACGERISINDLWNFIKEFSGSELQAIYREPRLGDVRNSLADTSKGKRLIGYQPVVTVKDGIQKTYEWFKDNYDFVKKLN